MSSLAGTETDMGTDDDVDTAGVDTGNGGADTRPGPGTGWLLESSRGLGAVTVDAAAKGLCPPPTNSNSEDSLDPPGCWVTVADIVVSLLSGCWIDFTQVSEL